MSNSSLPRIQSGKMLFDQKKERFDLKKERNVDKASGNPYFLFRGSSNTNYPMKIKAKASAVKIKKMGEITQFTESIKKNLKKTDGLAEKYEKINDYHLYDKVKTKNDRIRAKLHNSNTDFKSFKLESMDQNQWEALNTETSPKKKSPILSKSGYFD